MKPGMLAVSLLAALLMVGGCSKSEPQAQAQPQPSSQAAQGASALSPAGVQASGAPMQTLPDFATIAEANRGAVVNITSTVTRPRQMRLPFGGGQGNGDEQDDNPMNEFLRRFGMEGQMPPVPQQGMGSGFIVDPNVVILPNAHLVEGADELRLNLTDRREVKGKVAGLDHTTDIAVAKIDAKNLPTAKPR